MGLSRAAIVSASRCGQSFSADLLSRRVLFTSLCACRTGAKRARNVTITLQSDSLWRQCSTTRKLDYGLMGSKVVGGGKGGGRLGEGGQEGGGRKGLLSLHGRHVPICSLFQHLVGDAGVK